MLSMPMLKRFFPTATLLGLSVVSTVVPLHAASENFTPEQLEFFEKRVRPLLAEQCFSCHSDAAKKSKGGLRLDSRESILKGGDSGPAIVPGDPDKSRMITSVRYTHQDLQMPPKSKLPDSQIATLTEWVRLGAPWPAEKVQKQGTTEIFDLNKRKAEHWSWQPIRAAKAPTVKNTKWSAQPIDRFLLARLEESGLTPASPADPRALLRRLNFDLTGLPPKPDEADAFAREAATNRQAAVERVVDRLLASPQFGERWGRHWLDLVRYAETRGHEFDYPIPNAWQYRDYIVRALNADVPYKQLVTEHLAGDLVPSPRLNPQTGANESILGTGFWFLGEEVHSPVDIRGDETDRLDNRVDVMTKTFIGLTVSCARCHDHKFDAISQRDYYALNGFLISSNYRQARFGSLETHRGVAKELDELHQAARPALTKAAGEALKPGLAQASNYLSAACEVLQGETDPTGAAKKHGLDEAQLSRWVIALKTAKADPAHLLNNFATITDAPAGDSAEFVRRLAPLVDGWKKQKAEAQNAPPLKPENVIVDYATSSAREWMQDGWSFGLRPARVSEAVLGQSEDKPLAGFVTRDGAQRGEAWKKLAVQSPERDQGVLGTWDRSEQTLRTRDFTLNANSLWYLVRGSLRAYATVNSHLIVQGPLHGALLREYKDESLQWRWVQHDLRAYKGNRLHVEFSPAGNDLSIAMVVQAEARPALPPSDELLLTALADAKVQSPQAMAGAIAGVWQTVAEQMAKGTLAPGNASIADSLVRAQDLFTPPGSKAQRDFAAVARPFLTQQEKITARIQANSPTAPAMQDGLGTDELLLIRGQAKNPGETVPRRFIEALASTKPIAAEGSGRLELARQMTDDANPYTSRVMVNRVWHHLFGRGIVPTVDNFGVLGQAPSHRELLDYLALRFRNEQGWSLKKLVREIVLSQAYQMSSVPSDTRAEQVDPQNILLHRANVKRLDGESIRDAILSVSGRLDPKMGGAPVPVYLTPFMDGRGRPAGGPLDGNGRRSIYISVRRNFLQPMLLAFDTPIPFTTMGRRNISNVPAQALILMNDPFVAGQAKVWATNLPKDTAPSERVNLMYLKAFGRPATEKELKTALGFLEEQTKLYGADTSPTDERVWADFCHVLFNVKEFIYLR